MKTKNLMQFFGIIFIVVFLIGSVNSLEEKIFLDDYEITYNYASAEEGDTFTLTINILNTGNILKEDVIFELKDTGVFEIDGDDDWNIGSIEKDGKKSQSFRIEIDEGTNEGKYDLDFELEDSEDDWEDELEIEVESDKADLIIGNIMSYPEVVMPNQEDIKLEITIENTGGGDAKFVKANLELPEGVEASGSYSDLNNLGTIPKSSNKKSVFFIDTGEYLNSGNKKASIRLDYETDNNKETKTLDFNIPVKGKPLFEISNVKNIPTKIYPGTGSNQVSISIQNIGEETGKETSIRVFENSDQPFEFNEKTDFIGNIETGKSGTASFEFDVDEDGLEKEYLVDIQIRTINRDNVIVSEETIRMSLLKQERGIDLNNKKILIIGLSLGIVILLGLLTWILRR